MKELDFYSEMELLFEKVMNSHTMEDLHDLKKYVSVKRNHIHQNKKLITERSNSDLTTRIETGPSIMGWGKGKDE